MPGSAEPRFSVVVATRDRADVLGRAIASVLEQSLSALELIVVDDGSQDETRAVVESVRDPRLRYLRQDAGGCSRARNLGAAHATARMLAFLDDDDEAAPGWLEQLAAADGPSVGAICCGAAFTDSSGTVRRRTLPRPLGPLFGGMTGLYWPPGVFAVRRDVFERAGGYVDGLLASENFELGMRISRMLAEMTLDVAVVDETLVVIHNDRVGDRRRTGQYAATRLQGASYVLDRYSDVMGRHPRLHARWLSFQGVNAARLGRYREARRSFRAALRRRPALPDLVRYAVTLVPGLPKAVWPRPRPEAP